MANQSSDACERSNAAIERSDQPSGHVSSSHEEGDSAYSMNHGRRGDCIIFANAFTGTNKRVAVGTDADLCSEAFKKLGFKVKVHKNLPKQALLNTLDEVRRRDHSDCDALVVVFMSHGASQDGREYIITNDETPIPTCELWKPFSPDKCPSLMGKPKLFFIQACRGGAVDEGVGLKVSTDSSAAAPASQPSVPVIADHLVMWASSEGHYAFRTARYNCKEQSVFIHFLTDALKTHGTTLPLIDILLKVSRDVSVEFQSVNKKDVKYDGSKQASTMCSTLLRNIRFPKKRKKYFWQHLHSSKSHKGNSVE